MKNIALITLSTRLNKKVECSWLTHVLFDDLVFEDIMEE